jgi:hypothetical protein
VPKAINEQIVERTIVFTLSGSCIVDLKMEKGGAAIRLSNGTLTNFFCKLILQKQKQDSDHNKKSQKQLIIAQQ